MIEKEVLLWDWDDLLSGSLHVQGVAASKIIHSPKDLEDFRGAIKERPLPGEVELLLQNLCGTDGDFWKEVDCLYRQFTPLPPAATRVLEELSCRWNIVVQGSAPLATVELLLQEAGIYNLFQLAGGGDDLDRGKPDPEFFLRALDSYGVQEEKALIVTGWSGASAAAGSGIDFIYVPDEETRVQDPLFQKSRFFVQDLEDLLRCI